VNKYKNLTHWDIRVCVSHMNDNYVANYKGSSIYAEQLGENYK